MSKYKNRKLNTPDGEFDSHREYARYVELKMLERKGEISELMRQVPFELVPSHKLDNPRPMMRKGQFTGKYQRTEQAVKYFADFTYKKDGKLVVEDAKGMKTKGYIMKRKLMKHVHDIEIVEV